MDLWTGSALVLLVLSSWSDSLKLQIVCALVLGWRLFLRWCKGVTYTGTSRLDGSVALVTGANVGIGLATASELASRGSRVILACRDVAKAAAARDQIIKETGVTSDMVDIMELDLSSFASVR